MSEECSKVIEALRQGALNSKNQYVTVRREDLLLALGVPEQTNNEHQAAATGEAQRTTDKQR